MRWCLFTLFVFSLFSCNEHSSNETTKVSDSAIVTPSGADCSNVAATSKIKEAISLEELEGMTLEEAHEWKPCDTPGCQGLTYYKLDTVYEEHCLLSIKYTAEYMGAYPSTGISYYNFDLRTGNKLTASDIFDSGQLDALVKYCNDYINTLIEKSRKDVEATEVEDYNNGVSTRPEFTKESLNRFYLTNDGLVLNYDFEFPHVIQALSPVGDIPLSALQLKQYLKKDGSLNYMLQ